MIAVVRFQPEAARDTVNYLSSTQGDPLVQNIFLFGFLHAPFLYCLDSVKYFWAQNLADL